MPIYKQTTEITNIDDLLSSVERDIEEVYFGDKQVFTVWATYDGTLPAQYTANGSMLADYRVYGAAGGVGDETANIYDCADMSYGYEGGRSLNADGTTSINSNWCISSYIEVNPSTAYTINWYVGIPYPSFLCEYDENYNFIGSISEGLNKTFTTSSQTKYLRLSNTYRTAERSRRETCVLVEGSTAPASYVPYGYAVPIAVRSANIYNGEITQGVYNTANGNVLSTDRYVKSSKIHLDASGYITLAFNCPKQGTTATGTGIDGFVYFWGEGGYIGYYQATAKGTQMVQIPAGATSFAFAAGAGADNVLEPSDISKIMLNYGSAPLPYQPYFNTTTQIYIGSDPLGEDEYVDYGEGKVYRCPNLLNMNTLESGYLSTDGVVHSPSPASMVTDYMEVSQGKYTLSVSRTNNLYSGNTRYINYYNANKKYLSHGIYAPNPVLNDMSYDFTISNPNIKYARFTLDISYTKAVFHIENPAPTDPPVPLPALPTVDGTTIMSYAGQSIEPSEFYTKYRKQNF